MLLLTTKIELWSCVIHFRPTMIEDELGGWSAGDNYVMFAMEIFGENKGEKGGVKRNMQLCSCISVRLYFDKEKEMQENAIEVINISVV